MLIQLAGRFIIDPGQYPHRLVVELETGDGFGSGGHRECGVFSGMHDGFEDPAEMNRWIDGSPIDEETPWIQRYEIQAPNRSQPSRRRGYHYVAIGWHGGAYAAYPVPIEIVLEDSAGSWSVSIGHGNGVTVLMPDYSPWDQVTP
jgi:hypothetical protein